MNRAERFQAKKQGHTRYFTGKACKNGHIAERSTASGTCTVCSRNNDKRHRSTESYREKNRLHHRSAKYRLYEKRMLQRPSARAGSLLNSTRGRAARLNIKNTLTKKWILQRLEAGKCELTGLSFDLTTGSGRLPCGPSVDQIQAGKGYTPENCRLVLYSINAALRHWGLKEFLPIAKALVEKQHG